MPPRDSFRILKKAVRQGELWVAYTFEELNMVSFQNVYIWKIRQEYPNLVVTSIAPSAFIDLYNHANNRISMPDSYIENYQNIQNFREFRFIDWELENNFVKRNLKRLFFLVEVIPQWFVKKIHPMVLHALPFRIKAYGRSKYYYLRSGFRNEVEKMKPMKIALLESSSNFNTQTLGLGPAHNQAKFFDNGFQSLADMIKSGDGYSLKYLESSLKKAVESMTAKQIDQLGVITDFLEKNPRAVLLRTRNKRIATSNNANPDSLQEFLRCVIDLGYGVLNVGAPAINIANSAVQSLSHDLPPIVLMALGAKFTHVVTSCGGDFFTGWACVPYSLVLFDKEWSLSNLKTPTSLLEARREIGLKDLEIDGLGMRELKSAFANY